MTSFCTCNKNSFESLGNWQKNAFEFIQLYKSTIDAYVSNFFVDDHMRKLPKQWQSVLNEMTTEDLAGLLSGKHNPRLMLPLSLLSFRTCTQTFSLSRNPVDPDSHKVTQVFMQDSSPSVDQVPKVAVQIQLELPDARTEVKVKDGQYIPLNHCFRKHVKPKKQHEILELGKLINIVCQVCGCKHVVDVGAGQGHLSRLLNFGHGLKVTTVEASGCHAPKATKFDKDTSYAIRSHLKRRHEENKNGELSEENNDVNLPLPDHVTCMIQPSTTPSEFLSVIQHNTEEKDPNCNLCKQTFDNLGKVSQSPSDYMCENCIKVRKTSEDYKSLLLTGLHACGDLTPTILRVFSRCPDIRGVTSVGCCYMKMTTSKSETVEEIGYPMSKFTAGLPHHELNYEAREMACHSIDVYTQRLLDNPPHLKLHCYRAILQQIILHKNPDFVFGTTKLTIKKAEKMEFQKYAKLALEKLGLDSSIDEDVLGRVQGNLSQWKDVVAFYTIRLSLAPVVESVLLMDRMFYLMEQGISSHLIPVFDPSMSPRNFALVAYK